MALESWHAQERDELSRIDYFLDHLARAVERGEVPRASYDALAPRYLARRADLVAVLSSTRQTAPAGGIATPGSLTAGGTSRAAAAASAPRQRREHKPVRWTTVLLFLGAFLVIVASAIFALAVWNIAAPAFKLAFMGALTIAFYAAGSYSRSKLELRTGGTALTVVGSAMLLFDCWIIIDGFNLQSVLAWAAALLFCSLVYWFTEVRLGERFYGVAGAAAQVGWWWLLGTGLNLQYPLRFAGMAVVALIWQLTAERVRDESRFASLASVLIWTAPVVGAGALLALLVDAVTIGTPDARGLVATAVAVSAAAVIVWRTRLPLPNRPAVAAIAQLPLVFASLLAAESPGWLLVAVLGIMTAAYTITSLSGAGAPFAIVALVSEFALVSVVCDLLQADAHVTAVVFGALAVTWMLASRFASSLAERPADDALVSGMPGAFEFARIAARGGAVLLVLASAAALDAGAGVALTGVRVTAADAATCAGVLAAWTLATLAIRRPVGAVGASLWSLYALAALLAWAAPGLQSALYALALLAACAAWFSARTMMARFYRVDAGLFGWLYRVLAVLVVLGGIATQGFYFGQDPAWASAALALGAALFFAADAAFDGPAASAVVAGVAGTGAAFLAGHAFAVATTPRTGALAALAASPASLAAVTGAAGAAVFSATDALLRGRRSPRTGEFALAAAVAGTLLTGFALDEPRRVAAAFVLLALAWTSAAVARRSQVLCGVAGLSAFVSAMAFLAAMDGPPWLTVCVAALACVVLNAPTFLRVAGPGGAFARGGLSLSAAGNAGVVGMLALGAPYSIAPGVVDSTRWLAFGQHGEAALLAVIGALVLAQAVRWKSEPSLYVGFGVLLIALWTEMHALSFTTIELYSTPLALYLLGMGYLYARRVPGRGIPTALDVGAVLVGLGVPLTGALSGWGAEAFAHTAWTIGLSLAFITGGIAGRCRAYLFGGTGALALVAAWRTMTYLAEFWWLALGLIGMAMLVIALTWERQRMMLSETQQRLRDSFENWR